jgi:hypothetical protein
MGGGRRAERPAAAAPETWETRPPERSPGPRSWRDRVRRAVDLTVAFVLLEDASASAEPHVPAGRDRSRPPRASVDAAHPHRAPLRPSPRPRRPGAVPARPQPCLSPITGAGPHARA